MPNGVTGYVQPNDAGLRSTPQAVGKTLGKVLDSLATVNKWLVQGPIENELWEFRSQLIEKLRADGWEVKLNARDNFSVKPGKAYYNSLRNSA